MDKIFHLSIVWSSLIICKFQVYTAQAEFPVHGFFEKC